MKKYILLFIIGLIVFSCQDDTPRIVAEYDDTPYMLNYNHNNPPNLPEDNLLTNQGVLLGRMLFFEPLLSKNNQQSCASCHNQNNGFSDSARLSIGVEGLAGKRQAMGIFNMGWHTNAFFWDGRANLLRDQALKPIEDPLEMNETLENVIVKLEQKDRYKNQFIRAFGDDDITADRMGLAMEQFMLSILSFDSKFDKAKRNLVELTESEERGRLLFETEFNPFFPDQSGADCQHCHGGINFENDRYMNNGLDTDAEITDVGREMVTNNPNDKAKFKVPSLRNIALTAPYMHDGRFATLEEVIDHYDHGIQPSSTLDPTLENTRATGLSLSAQDKTDLINFLHTLTDETFVNNPEYKKP